MNGYVGWYYLDELPSNNWDKSLSKIVNDKRALRECSRGELVNGTTRLTNTQLVAQRGMEGKESGSMLSYHRKFTSQSLHCGFDILVLLKLSL
uniref:Uncharacterized protein n=1 Tax=Onchocerca volvulus TaxID=6282 RepID=A0A8R1TSV2_ONCVO